MVTVQDKKRNESYEELGHILPNQLWLGNGMNQEFTDGDNRKNF